jgi:hypothetical protein
MNRLLLILLFIGVLLCFAYNTQGHPASHAAHGSPVISLQAGASDLEKAQAVQGPPTLSAAFIDQFLRAAGSPAAGLGTTLYALSLKYGIDDAHSLAFFHHESEYGKYGMAASTHSLGNIRCSVGYSCDPTGGYRSYESWADGAQDWYHIIHDGYLGRGPNKERGLVSQACPCLTVSTIIPVYAPASDNNDVQAYIHSILADVVAYRERAAQGGERSPL